MSGNSINESRRKDSVRIGINRLMGCVDLVLFFFAFLHHLHLVLNLIRVNLIFRINKKRKPSAKILAAKQVARRYNFISSQRLADLRHEKLKKKLKAR